jgi:hypothetical protein
MGRALFLRAVKAKRGGVVWLSTSRVGCGGYRRLALAVASPESGAEEGDGWRGRGEEAVRRATSPDDGVPRYGIYSAAARAGVVLVMVEGVRGGRESLPVGKWLGSGWEVVGVFFFQLLPDS